PVFFFFSSRRRHTSFSRDWSSDVCSSDLKSVTSLAIAGLLDSPPAEISAELLRYRDVELLSLSAAERRATGGREIAMVYQDALRSEERRVGKAWKSRRNPEQ